MRDLQKALNSVFMASGSKLDYLAKMVTEDLSRLNVRLQAIENAVGLMQQAMIQIELVLNTIKNDPFIPKKKTGIKRNVKNKRDNNDS